MDNDSGLNTAVQGEYEKFVIGGYKAASKTYPATPVAPHKTQEEYDSAQLENIRTSGLAVTSLDELPELARITPVRTLTDLFSLQGYSSNPTRGSKVVRPAFTDAQLTALAFEYPNPSKIGETYPYTYYIRLRPSSPYCNSKGESSKYLQPQRIKTGTTSEPYFLAIKEVWERLYDKRLILYICEGEKKAIAMCLAGFAAISFPGCTMGMSESVKGLKGAIKIHPSLDPSRVQGRKPIPIDRQIVLLPDTNYKSNIGVRTGFLNIGKSLIKAGADNVSILHIPTTQDNHVNGIDDFLYELEGPGWSDSPDKIQRQHEIIVELTKQTEKLKHSILYHPTEIIRLASDVVEYCSDVNHLSLMAIDVVDKKELKLGIPTYRNDRWEMDEPQTKPDRSGKSIPHSDYFRKLSLEVYTQGVYTGMEEGTITEPEGPPKDLCPRIMNLVEINLPQATINTVITPFNNVSESDKCVRIRGGIVNLTECLKYNVSWADRSRWLSPPNHNWFSLIELNVSLANMQDRPQCPVFLETITHAFAGDQQSIDCLQLFMGKIITCPMFISLQQFLSMYGQPGSGKGTITRLITSIIGEHNLATPDEKLDGKHATSELPEKSLIVFMDANEQFSDDAASLIKKITGEDTVCIEKKYNRIQYMRIYSEIITVSNEPPVIPMDAGALKRRAVFLKFPQMIKERNYRVEDHMRSNELPGIFLWALEGAAKLFRGKEIETPRIAMDDLIDILEDFSLEKQFVHNEIIKNEKAHLLVSNLIEKYQEWLRERRKSVTQTSTRKLCRHVREAYGIAADKQIWANGKNEKAFPGLMLKSPI